MIISIIRAALLYTFIILAIRIMGKRQISELQTSELVVTLLISDIAAIPMQDTAQPLVSGTNCRFSDCRNCCIRINGKTFRISKSCMRQSYYLN